MLGQISCFVATNGWWHTRGTGARYLSWLHAMNLASCCRGLWNRLCLDLCSAPTRSLGASASTLKPLSPHTSETLFDLHLALGTSNFEALSQSSVYSGACSDQSRTLGSKRTQAGQHADHVQQASIKFDEQCCCLSSTAVALISLRCTLSDTTLDLA